VKEKERNWKANSAAIFIVNLLVFLIALRDEPQHVDVLESQFHTYQSKIRLIRVIMDCTICETESNY
jgi:hypothetical protein